MHIMEGFLPPAHAIGWAAASLPFLAFGLRSVKRTLATHPEQRMLLGVAAAFAFLLSALKLPSVTGSCSHPTGIGLGALLFGPAAMVPVGFVVLLFQALLLAHDAVVMLFPFWWYSSPAIFKEWQDNVLEHGFAYGTGGDRLHGKPFLLMVSTGGGEQAYSPQGYNRYPIEEFWLPFKAMANMTGMVWQPPALIQGTHVLTDSDLDAGVSRWLSHLHALSV